MGKVAVFSTHGYTLGIENRLKERGDQLVVIPNSERFNFFISNNGFDLIILDSSNEVNIKEYVQLIRESSLNSSTSVLYTVPCRVTYDFHFKGIDQGPMIGISKPFSSSEFLNTVRVLIGQKSQRDSLERSLKEIEHFTAMTSHDLRTPLKNIFSYADILGDDLAEESYDQVEKYLNTIKKETSRLLDYVEDMFQLAKIGSAEIRVDNVNLKEDIQQIYEEVHSKYKDRKAHLKLINVPQNYKVDSVKFTHILQNLIENSFKYSDKEQALELSIEFAMRSAAESLFTFSDNGKGILLDNLESVFKPFKRVDTDT